MFTERFVEIIQKKQIKPYHISQKTGISAGLMSEYKNGVKLPTLQNLIKIADCLDCSADYLLGLDDIPNRKEISQIELSKLEIECLTGFQQLDTEGKIRILERIESLKENCAAEKDSKLETV